jgi:Arc/MetJ-type ribon-helix-helix transcriptional regulator
METTSIRLPHELIVTLERARTRRGVTRSDLVREAIEAYLRQIQEAPTSGLGALVDSLVTYPGSGVGDLATRGEHYLREKFGARRRRPR